MTFDECKIYGERNSGTNFLEKLIDENFEIKERPKASLLQKKLFREQRLLYQRFAKSLKSTEKNKNSRNLSLHIVKQRMLDIERSIKFNQEMGWKHTKVDYEKISSVPNFEKTFIIFLIRNPWNFALSLYKKPYNLIPPMGNKTFSEFIRSPILVNERDGFLNTTLIANPLELWRQKTLSYIQFHRKSPENSLIVSYEDIVLNTSQFVDSLETKLNRSSQVLRIPLTSVKDDDRTYEFFQNSIRNFNVKSQMKIKDAKFIADCIGIDLIKSTKYQNIFI